LKTALTRLNRPFLHAWRLTVVHPHYGKTQDFEAPLPSDLVEILRILGYDDTEGLFDRDRGSWL
jgi:hypothetical protein